MAEDNNSTLDLILRLNSKIYLIFRLTFLVVYVACLLYRGGRVYAE